MRTVISLLALFGLADASYLTFEHFLGSIPPCTIGGCETVLSSQYAAIGPIPLALLGVLYYLTVLILSRQATQKAALGLVAVTSAGLIASAILIYLQLEVIRSICVYCMTSAGITTLLWILSLVRAASVRHQQASA